MPAWRPTPCCGRSIPRIWPTPRETWADFLIQYWGGPDDYSRRQGHPMLRARHLPFAIGRRERDAWMHHMTAAVHAADSSAAAAQELLEYFERAATHLVNTETPKGHLPIVPPPGDAWGGD